MNEVSLGLVSRSACDWQLETKQCIINHGNIIKWCGEWTKRKSFELEYCVVVGGSVDVVVGETKLYNGIALPGEIRKYSLIPALKKF